MCYGSDCPNEIISGPNIGECSKGLADCGLCFECPPDEEKEQEENGE